MPRLASALLALALLTAASANAADFFTHFPKKTEFTQSMVIDAVLKEAHKKAELKASTKDGVCALVTLQWAVASEDKGGPDQGFATLLAEDVKTPKGLAFWTQILGAFKTYSENPDGILGSGGRRTEVLELLSKKKLKATFKGDAKDAAGLEKLVKSGSYYYLSLKLANGGHAIGLHVGPKGIQLMDPNGGLTAVGAATGMLTDMITTYKANSVHVFEIEKA